MQDYLQQTGTIPAEGGATAGAGTFEAAIPELTSAAAAPSLLTVKDALDSARLASKLFGGKQQPTGPQQPFQPQAMQPKSIQIQNFSQSVIERIKQKKVVKKYITTNNFSKYQPKLAAARVHPSNYGERFSRDTKGMAVSNQPIIVLHETTYSARSAINYFQNHNVDEDIQASYHAIIARDGTVIYLVPPDKRAFGAGNSVFKNTDGTIETVQTNPKLAPSVNNFAYHVSLETPPDGWGKRDIREHSGYTQEQYNSLAWLIAQSQVPDERITTHRAVDVANGKVDPLSFDFERFFKKLHSFRKLHSIAQSHS